MFDIFLVEKISVARLRQRGHIEASGAVRVEMPDGHGDVRLSAREWEQLGEWLTEQLAPTARALRGSTFLGLPFAIALLGIMANVPPLERSLASLHGVAATILSLLILLGYPVAMTVRHGMAVGTAISQIDSVLAERPRAAAPPIPPGGGVNMLEIAGIVLVGPHLAVQLLGSLSPGMLRNTPFTGARVDATALVGLVVLGGLLCLRLRARRQLG